MAEITYAKELGKKHVMQIRKILSELPPYVASYNRSIEETTQPRTRIGYLTDIKAFFDYLIESNSYIKSSSGGSTKGIKTDALNNLTAQDFEEYLEYVTYYVKDGREYTNDSRSKKRKICALRGFFKYLYINDYIEQNVTEKVATPKIHDKAIIRMETDEVADFLDNVEYGSCLTSRQQAFHEKEKTRDLALLTLMLSTGIRVSECVGLNINDVDIKNTRIKVTRKGGYEAFVYFSDEALEPLLAYMEERKKMKDVKSGHEDALFLSSHRSRITVRTVQHLVKKYAEVTTPMKHITPHKLRSTYGTALYHETGDIYLVADVLGHKDVNTTRKHYADMDQERKRGARNVVTLREKNDN